jgi:hypothetical protein
VPPLFLFAAGAELLSLAAVVVPLLRARRAAA